MAQPKPKNQNELSPNHVMRMQRLLGTTRSTDQAYHPLVVPDQPSSQNSFGQDDQWVPMKSGEYIIPEPVVKRKGTQFFDNLVKKTLSEIMPPEQVAMAGTGSPQEGFSHGGEAEWTDPSELNQNLNFGPPSTSITGNYNIPANSNWMQGYSGNLWSPYQQGTPQWQNWANTEQNNFDMNFPNQDQADAMNIQGEYGHGFNPWLSFNSPQALTWGNQGSQGQTMDNTFFNPEGIPYAIPVDPYTSSLVNPTMVGGAYHMGQDYQPT